MAQSRFTAATTGSHFAYEKRRCARQRTKQSKKRTQQQPCVRTRSVVREIAFFSGGVFEWRRTTARTESRIGFLEAWLWIIISTVQSLCIIASE